MLGPFGAGGAEAKRLELIGRLILAGADPLLVVLLALRDRPSRYGARGSGDWRAGAVIAVAGCALMTPVVLALARVDGRSPRTTRRRRAAPLDVVITTALEVIPAEFFFRGFLLFALLRVDRADRGRDRDRFRSRSSTSASPRSRR